MSASRVLGLVAFTSWLMAGCSGDSPKLQAGETCVINSDCAASLTCTMGKCHDACKVSTDCPAGQTCLKSNNTTICQLPVEADCSRTSCGGVLVCASDLRCRSACQAAADCTSGQVCVTAVCADPSDLDINGQLPQKAPLADAGVKDAGRDVTYADIAVVDLPPADSTPVGGAEVAVVAPEAGPADATVADAKLLDTPAADSGAPDTTAVADTSTVFDVPAIPDVTIVPDAPPTDGASQVLTGCSAPPLGQRYFCDDFEAGLDKWVVSGQDWNTTTTTWRSASHSISDSPDGDYTSNENAAIMMAASVDLTSATSPILSFWYKLNLYAAYSSDCYNPCDRAYVEVSSDGGVNWSEIVSWWSTTNTSTWVLAQLALSSYKGKKIKIRFRLLDSTNTFYSPGQADGWYIDDVEIREAN
jgi:hypothetical protein